MGNRVLKESICTSEQIDNLDFIAEVFFYRLLVNCDDYGVMDGRPKILKAKLFPLKEISLGEIERSVQTLAREGLIRLYTVDGKPYIQVIKWAEHQRLRMAKHHYPTIDTEGSVETPIEEPDEEPDEVDDAMPADYGESPQDSGDERLEDGDERSDAETRSNSPQPAATCRETRQSAATCGLTRARIKNPNPNPNPNPNTNTNTNTNTNSARGKGTDPAFDAFYREYPKKIAKQDAIKAWGTIRPDAEMTEKIMRGLDRWKKSEDWNRDGGRFIPYPATWLRGRRWEDEVPAGGRTVSGQNYEQRDYSDVERRAYDRMRRMVEEGMLEI